MTKISFPAANQRQSKRLITALAVVVLAVISLLGFFVTVGLASEDVLAGWRARALAVGLSGLLLGLLTGLLYWLWRAEAALKANEELMRSTFEQAAVGIAHIDPDTYRILMANHKFCDLLGYTQDELTGTDSRLLTPPDDMPARAAERAQVMAGTIKTSSSERCLIKKNGASLWVNRSLSLVRDLAGQPQYFISVIEDITERKQAQAERAQLAVIVESSNDAIMSRSLDLKVMSWNAAAERLFGYSAAEAIGQDIYALIVPPERETEAERTRAQLAQDRAVLDFETVRRTKDGRLIDVSLSQSPIINEHGVMTGVALIFRDIRERKQAEAALRKSEAQLRLFAENVPAMTVSWDENLRCRFANSAYAEFFGFSVENILGRHLQEVVGEEAYQEIEGHFVQVLRGHPVTYQRTLMLQDGESRYLEIKLLPHIGKRGQALGCFAVITDITEHKLTEERIQRVAHHDSLTGLPNRLLFNDRLDQAISIAKRGSRQFALLYLDLNKFKPVNDTLGHTAGDELLISVAARIRHQLRESDTVARIGGDEFTVILPDITGREEAETVAGKIIAALATPFQLGSQHQSVDIGTSIGIAVYPADAQDADALVNAADAAMYSAKQAGSNFRSCAA